MSQRDKIVTIFIKWVTQGDKKIAKGTLDKLKKLDEIAGGIAGKMQMARADIMSAFIDVGTDSKKNLAIITDSMKAHGGISKAVAKTTLAINTMAKTFEDSGATAGEMKKVIDGLAKDFGVEPEKLTGWIVDYSTTMLREFAKMEKGVSASTTTQKEQAEALRKAFIATRKVDTTEAWQKRAKALYEGIQNQRDLEIGLNKVAKAMVKGKGVIDKDTAALFSNVSAGLKVHDLSKEMSKQVEREIKLGEKEGSGRKKKDKNMKKEGMRYSWLGYRLFSMGRILQKWILKPLQDTIKVMSKWQASIEEAAVTMALAEYFAIDLGEAANKGADYFAEFAEKAMRLNTSFGAMKIFMMDVASDISGPLGSAVLGITNKLRDLWEGVKNTIGPEGFVALLGVLTLATTAMIAFGSIMFFLAPIAAALGTTIAVLLGAFLAIGAVVLVAIAHWKELKEFWDKSIGPAMKNLNDAFGMLGDALGSNITVWKAFKWATTPIVDILKMVIDAVSWAIDVFAILIATMSDVVKGFQGMGRWADNVFGHSIGKDIARDLTPAIKSMEDLNKQMGGIRGGAGGGGVSSGPQYVSIYPEISLAGATISSNIDLLQITDAAERGISDALRRRAYPRWGRR